MENRSGERLYMLADRLFPICRSITGDGVRQTLRVLSEIYPINQYEVPSGTKVFDWIIPKEWNVSNAWVAEESGSKIIDFKENNLHLVGYSIPFDGVIDAAELLEHIYSIPEQPAWIPYVTSYYKERWGFCVADQQKQRIRQQGGRYHVHIDSDLKEGSLTYGEILIPSTTETREEIFLSTYICHPSMANNELSGPCIMIYLAKWLASLKKRNFNYRIVFLPETIGSITYLSRNLQAMKENIIAGFNLTCLGNEDHFSYIPSRSGNTLADKVALNVLSFQDPEFYQYTYLDRGSDERQYCSPGVDLPVCSITKSKYGTYLEYHTSADNMQFITPKALEESFNLYQTILKVLEANYFYKIRCLGEPQLGPRGLYPTESYKGSSDSVREMMNVIAYADGRNSIIEISEIIGISSERVIEILNRLMAAGLVEKV